MFFQVFAGGEQRYHPSRRAVVSRFCITEVRPRPYADLWQTRHRVNVDQTIKISSGSIGGTPEATSAIIHQRIFVTCKRHFSSVSGGSIPTRPLSPSIHPLPPIRLHMSPGMRPLIRRINQASLDGYEGLRKPRFEL